MSTSPTPSTSPALTGADRFVDLDAYIDAIDNDPAQAAGARTVLAEIDAGQAEHALGLQMLRASFGLTQTALAEALGLSQANIAQTEHRGDLLVSTLRRYIETITGGDLRLIVTFADRPPLEFELGEVTTATTPARPHLHAPRQPQTPKKQTSAAKAGGSRQPSPPTPAKKKAAARQRVKA